MLERSQTVRWAFPCARLTHGLPHPGSSPTRWPIYRRMMTPVGHADWTVTLNHD